MTAEAAMHVYGLDPGKLNGIIVGAYSKDAAFTVYESYELLGGPAEVGDHFEQWCADTFSVPRRLIYEGWNSLSNMDFNADANWSCQPIGAVEYIARRHDLNWPLPIKVRQPGPPHEAIPNQMLKDSGYWLVGGEGHKRAILKHVLQQLIDEGHGPTMRQLYGRGTA